MQRGRGRRAVQGASRPRGWCHRHYQRWRTHGDPLICLKKKTPPTASERAWSKANGLIPLKREDGSIAAHARADVADCDWLSQWRWYLDARGYVVRMERHKGRMRIVYMHRVLVGLAHGDRRYADHKSGDRLDNRRANLRIATASQNGQNRRGLDANNTSGYRGVYKPKKLSKWIACCQLNGHQYRLGSFDGLLDAARAAEAFRRRHMPFASPDVTLDPVPPCCCRICKENQ